MDYLDLVLQGYFNEVNREFLNDYFYREFKKAEQEHYKPDEFFKGCLGIIELFNHNLQDQINNRTSQLYLMQTMTKDKDKLREFENELNDVRPDGIGALTFNVHLYSLTNGRYNVNISFDEVKDIEAAIISAYTKVFKEFTEGLEKSMPKKQKSKSPELEQMLDKKYQKIINKFCTDEGFVEVKDGSLHWTGIKDEFAKGRGLQFVAITDICKPFYNKKDYTEKELWQAWTKYYNYIISENMFSESKRPSPDSNYHKLFSGLIYSLRSN